MQDDRSVQAKLLPTPMVSSFVGRARPGGDLSDSDPARRAAAWAHWAVTSMTEMTGLADRAYTALALPGKFYDPRGTGPTVRPHLEIPLHALGRPDPEFPDRLSLAGNALLSPWWVLPEVVAVRRALMNTPRGSIGELSDLLTERRTGLVAAVTELLKAAAPRWPVMETGLVTDPTGLAAVAAGDFTTAEVAEFLPAAADLGLHVAFDAKLRETNGGWVARRTGVWQLRGRNGHPFALGAVTPRLTKNSMFTDPLYAPDRDGSAALLVRALLLRRVLRTCLGVPVPHAGAQVSMHASEPEPPAPRLRVVVAQPGHKLPEASVESAVHFLQSYPDGKTAWDVLARWARDSQLLLTVAEDGFIAAHREALRALRRAEDPTRDDINVCLPLGWDEKNRVVRVTFTRPRLDPAEQA